mmetsp:Transcript_28207/g.96073  ORF Transcript_28207/g.96073 Transcript_28207/m.96073 type:complete len:260 (-) Transcript_28207:91-870(-)
MSWNTTVPAPTRCAAPAGSAPSQSQPSPHSSAGVPLVTISQDAAASGPASAAICRISAAACSYDCDADAARSSAVPLVRWPSYACTPLKRPPALRKADIARPASAAGHPVRSMPTLTSTKTPRGAGTDAAPIPSSASVDSLTLGHASCTAASLWRLGPTGWWATRTSHRPPPRRLPCWNSCRAAHSTDASLVVATLKCVTPAEASSSHTAGSFVVLRCGRHLLGPPHRATMVRTLRRTIGMWTTREGLRSSDSSESSSS